MITRNLLPAFAAAAFVSTLCVAEADADVLLSTDFTGLTVNGTDAAQGDNISWSEDGLTAPTSLTASANLFTSGAAAATNGYFGTVQNINTGDWSTVLTITVGASNVELDNIVVTTVEHNSGGTLGGGNGSSVITVSVEDNTTNTTVANPAGQLTDGGNNGDANPDPLTFVAGSPLVLTAGNTYDVTILLSKNNSSGHFETIDAIEFNGTVVPEPGSLALMACGGLMMIKRRRG